MKRLVFREVRVTEMAEEFAGKRKASQARGEYAHKGTYVNVSNLIIVPFRVLINQLCNRRHYEQ